MNKPMTKEELLIWNTAKWEQCEDELRFLDDVMLEFGAGHELKALGMLEQRHNKMLFLTLQCANTANEIAKEKGE